MRVCICAYKVGKIFCWIFEGNNVPYKHSASMKFHWWKILKEFFWKRSKRKFNWPGGWFHYNQQCFSFAKLKIIFFFIINRNTIPGHEIWRHSWPKFETIKYLHFVIWICCFVMGNNIFFFQSSYPLCNVLEYYSFMLCAHTK